MRNANTILSLGILLALLPFLGLPGAWKNLLLVAFGFIFCLIALSLYRRELGYPKQKETGQNEDSKPFVENLDAGLPEEKNFSKISHDKSAKV